MVNQFDKYLKLVQNRAVDAFENRRQLQCGEYTVAQLAASAGPRDVQGRRRTSPMLHTRLHSGLQSNC